MIRYEKGKNMNQWRIYQDAHAEWRWWKLDGEGNIIQASESGFVTREDCENDAMIHGYIAD